MNYKRRRVILVALSSTVDCIHLCMINAFDAHTMPDSMLRQVWSIICLFMAVGWGGGGHVAYSHVILTRCLAEHRVSVASLTYAELRTYMTLCARHGEGAFVCSHGIFLIRQLA